MTLDELKAFLAVADAGGFTRAARALNRSQPAVSRRIDQLEKALGAPLFARRGGAVALTAAGEALLPHAESALAAVRDAERAVRESAARAEETLTLAVVGTIADGILLRGLQAFQEQFASTRFDLRTANSRQVSDFVRRGEAVIGLRYFPDFDPQVIATELGAERLYVVVPGNHPLTATRQADLSAFADDRWVAFPSDPGPAPCFRDMLEAEFAASGARTARITTVDSLTAQKRLVEGGFAVALMPRRNVAEELRAGALRLIDVDSVTARMPIVIIQRRAGRRGAAAEALAALLRDTVPALLDA